MVVVPEAAQYQNVFDFAKIEELFYRPVVGDQTMTL
jgi:hypothetical protein